MAAANCGGDDGAAPATDAPTTIVSPTSAAPESTAAATTTTVDPDAARLMHPGALEPGDYLGNKFTVPVSFTIGEGWEGMESADSLLVVEPSVDAAAGVVGELALLNAVAEMTVDEAVAELMADEDVAFSAPEPSSIGGIEGVVVSAEATEDELSYSLLYDPAFDSPFYVPAGFRHEVHVLAAETGTVIVLIDADADSWEQFRSKVQGVLDSIVWEE